MSNKRKDTYSISDELRYAKRARPSYEDDDHDDEPSTTSSYCEKPRNDPVYGQKNAFPGLDGPGNDEMFYGPPEDGIEYLRMVRSEANTLPHFFIAPRPSETVPDEAVETGENGAERVPEQEGFYIDGVYIAPSTTNDQPLPYATSTGESGPDPQESYYSLLQHRFLLLRSTLKCTPPATTIASLDTSHPITFPPNSKRARSEWRRLLQTVEPQMSQLACMDMDTVLALLGVLTRLLSEVVRGGEAMNVKRLGAWAWGLLGRCRDIGELGSGDVGEIRDLGKRAAKVLAKIRETQREMQDYQFQRQEEEEQSEPDDGDTETIVDAEDTNSAPLTEVTVVSEVSALDVTEEIPSVNSSDIQEDLEVAKARLQEKLSGNGPSVSAAASPSAEEGEVEEEEEQEEVNGPNETRKQSRAMLDMIITIVGEFYGQRDLLESRDLWDEDLEEW